MPDAVRTTLTPAPGCRSAEVALLLAALDDQSRRLIEETRDLSPAELSWQPAPGMNTIGMLLAHVAVAETHLGQVGLLGEDHGHVRDVLGIEVRDEGMPLPKGGRPSPALEGKDNAFFADLLARARAHTRKVAATLSDADLEREITRTRRDGAQRISNLRWILYHMLEHEAAHFGQILQLRHMLRERG
jgi:uncharacterized damage-inducible protein DinB